MAHSKRNTSLAYFTAHERAELRSTWGSQQTRLTRDSYLPFGHCTICLSTAKDPVTCSGAPDEASRRRRCHLFCRECALASILSQKQKRKRLAASEIQELDEANAHAKNEHQQAEKDATADFAAAQLPRHKPRSPVHHTTNTRKRRLLEQSGSVSTPTSSFWVPGRSSESKIPDTGPLKSQPAPAAPSCPASTESSTHAFSLATLVVVNFSKIADSNSYDCPACQKVLTNASKAVLASPCGHVLCSACTETFVEQPEPSKTDPARCFVCSEPVTDTPYTDAMQEVDKKGSKTKKIQKLGRKRSLMSIGSEGTAFAEGGKNMVKREGVSFQC